MKSSIRTKIVLSLTGIFVVSGVLLNILIRQVFQNNLEKTIKSSMYDIMRSSRDIIVNNINAEELYKDEKVFYKNVSKIVNSSLMINSYGYEIRNREGKIVDTNINNESNTLLEKGTKSALEGRAVINIKYEEEDATGVLSYPIYSGEKFLGILNISSSYSDMYIDNKRIINMITLIEVIVFAAIFIAAYLITNRMISPIIALTKQVQKIEEGNYEVDIEVKSKDEIGILIKEFIKMKDKIKEQIDTINSKREKVEKLEKVRREFFNNVTHELKTPLTAISGYSQILLDDRTEDEEFKHRAVERIYLESERLHKLVLDLISVSKGTLFAEEDKKHVDMEQLLMDICSDMKIKADKYSISIHKDIESGTVLGQQRRLQQLIINLVDNAIKYSTNENSVIVRGRIEDEKYIIEVKNSGGPIEEQIYNNIFDPFIKGKENVEDGSSGLGLYICSEIVEEHEGRITIENGDEIIAKVEIPLISN